MNLTEIGAHAAMQGTSEKLALAERLHITDYITGVSFCHEASAYMGYLMHRDILPYQLTDTLPNDWINVFRFRERAIVWNGKDPFPKGAIIGFEAPHASHPSGITHSATATGVGCFTRGVNSHLFNPGWSHEKDLQAMSGVPNNDGTFNIDGAKYTIYVLPLEQ